MVWRKEGSDMQSGGLHVWRAEGHPISPDDNHSPDAFKSLHCGGTQVLWCYVVQLFPGQLSGFLTCSK
jgi:hypothetical protein